MKTIKVDLNRYISPRAIEKMRYQKYNAPQIDDGNLLCDEFFRQEELFDRKIDVTDYFDRRYGTDDILAIDRTSIHACDERNLFGSNAAYIESDLPYYVDIIGENKRIYLESYGTKSPKYPNHRVDGKGIYSDYDIDDVVNIKYHSRLDAGGSIESPSLQQEALQLIKQSYPIELVVEFMKRSKLKKTNGDFNYTPGFLTFISQFPDMRAKMVSKDFLGNEILDQLGVEVFPKICEKFDYDKEKAYKFLCDCRTRYTDFHFVETRKAKYKAAMAILDNTGEWTEEASELIRSVGSSQNQKLKQIRELAEDGKSIAEIKKIIFKEATD